MNGSGIGVESRLNRCAFAESHRASLWISWLCGDVCLICVCFVWFVVEVFEAGCC